MTTTGPTAASQISGGIIVGIVTLTGVGSKLSDIVTSTAASLATQLYSLFGGWLFTTQGMTLFFTLIMTAFVCLLLGCGRADDADLHHHGDDRAACTPEARRRTDRLPLLRLS